MKYKIQLVSVVSLLLSCPSFGFEINTHQAITKCALSSECLGIKEQQGAENLNYFAFTMQLHNVSYNDYKFEDYNENNDSYFKYAKTGEGLGDIEGDNKIINFIEGKTYLKNATDNDGNIILGEDGKPTNLLSYTDTSYISLIEAGSILEDALYPHADSLAFGGDGRFNNHFYSAQFSVAARTPYVRDALINTVKKTAIEVENLLRESDTALISHGAFDAYGHRTDNISWALDSTVSLKARGFPDPTEVIYRRNDYNLPNAFEYYRKSFGGTKTQREENQAKLFVSLGHVLHMLEDLHSPAHVRNGPHAGGDYLEIFGRHNGGFFLRDGAFTANNNSEIKESIKNLDVNDIMLTKNNYSSYQDFFREEARWVSQNFFSEAHNLDILQKEDQNFETGEGVELHDDWCGSRNTTIYDINPLLSPSHTFTSRRDGSWDFLKTNGNASYVKGDIPNDTVVAFQERNSFLWFAKCRTMSAANFRGSFQSYADFDKTALKDTAKNVIPRAVASVQAFTNFFFRGRMEAHLSFDNEYIIVENVSDPSLVSSPDFLTFQMDADPSQHKSFKLYYVGDNGVSIPLNDEQAIGAEGFSLDSDLFATDSTSAQTHESKNKYAIRISDLLRVNNIVINPGENHKLLLVFDGKIGNESVLGIDDYDIGATGLSATYVKKSLIKKTGQTESVVHGDDGTHQKGAPTYLVREPLRDPDDASSAVVADTVLDVTTGLMWQDDSDVGSIRKRWFDVDTNPDKEDLSDTSGDTATTYCSALATGGYSDWRLPNIKELSSIIDYGRFPAIDDFSFNYPLRDIMFSQRSEDVLYWSSNEVISTERNVNSTKERYFAYVMQFAHGRIMAIPKYRVNGGLYKGLDINIRCVRGYSEPLTDKAQFSVKNETVIDSKTKLEWERINSTILFTWNNAVEHCNALNGGKWRLPNVNELISLMDFDKPAPYFSDQFNDDYTNYVASVGDYEDFYTTRKFNYKSSTKLKSENRFFGASVLGGISHRPATGYYLDPYSYVATISLGLDLPSVVRCVR